MNAIQKLIKKIEADPNKTTELEWVLDIAYKDTGLAKRMIDEAAAELADKNAVIEAARAVITHTKMAAGYIPAELEALAAALAKLDGAK